MADTAISFDTPELDLSGGADDGADLGDGGDGQPIEGAEGAGEGDGAPADGAEGDQTGKPFLAVDNGKLSKVAKETIDELKVKNPQLAKAVQRALFAEDRLRRELPGGFKDLTALRGKLEELGGDEGIQTIQGELNGWKEFDAQYTAGDPKVLEFLTETPEAAAAFLKIAPAAFEKFREQHPDGYSAYVSQVFMADMNDAQLPMNIQLLGHVLSRATLSEPDKAEATKLYQSLVDYVNRVGGMAKKQVAAPTPTATKGADPRAADLDTREQSIRRTEWESETSRNHSQIFNEAWKRLAPNVPEKQLQTVFDLYSVRLKQAIAAKKDFDSNMDRYFRAKQKDGFVKLHKSTFTDIVPLTLRKTLAEFGIGARKAPAAAGAPKPGEAPKPGVPKPAVGFIPGVKPSMAEVNNVLTSATMWQNKQAVLKNGTRRSWQ